MEPTEPITESPPRKRRWYQYSLRTMLALMVLASIGMSWVGVKMQKARRQREAVEAILETGGEAIYDFEPDPDGNRVRDAEPRGPAWLRHFAGDDVFATVVCAEVTNDAGMEYAATLGQLQVLYCLDITDAGLKHLTKWNRLRGLRVVETRITDAGLAGLEKALPNCNIE